MAVAEPPSCPEELEAFAKDAMSLLLELWVLEGSSSPLGPKLSKMIDRGIELFPPPMARHSIDEWLRPPF